MKSSRAIAGVFGTFVWAFLVVGNAAQSADPAQAKPAFKGVVVAYEAGQSITVEVATPEGKRKVQFAIVKGKTELKLPGDAKVLKVGMLASVWVDGAGAGNGFAPKVAAKIEASPAGPNTATPPNANK